MVRMLLKALFTLTVGGFHAASEHFHDRSERRLVARLTVTDIKHIGDQYILAKVVRFHHDRHAVLAAASKLTDQQQIEFFAHDDSIPDEVRVEIIKRLADDHARIGIIQRSGNVILAQAAADGIREPWAFRELLRSPMVTVRAIGARNCRDAEVLHNFYADRDERVRDFAECSLVEIGIDPNTRAAARLA